MNRRNQSKPSGGRTQSQPSGSRIQPAPKQSSGDKVLIVFSCYGKDSHNPSDTHRKYKLCVVDLNSSDKEAIDEGDEFRPISPTLEIHTGRYVADLGQAFCVFGETLYMFNGFDASLENDEVEYEKSIFTIDLSSLHNPKQTHCSLLKKDLTKVGDMCYPKDQPAAVLTPDGKKILLFATKLRVSVISHIGGAFELYDPVKGISEALPLIDDIRKSDIPRLLLLRTYGFISMYKFVVHINGLGSYVIDLELRYRKRRWENLNRFGNYVRCYHEKPFFMIEDRFLFTPRIVEDTSLVKNSSRIKSSLHVDDDVLRGRDIALLKHDKDKGTCSFCLLYFEVHFLPSLQLLCNLYVDVYCAFYSNKDKNERKENVKEREEKIMEEDKKGKEKQWEKDPVEIHLISTRALKLTCEPEEGIFLFSPAFIFSI